MAQLEKLLPLILKWEGGYVNDPADLGGATNKGVTLAVWKRQGYDKNSDGEIDAEDLKLITTEDMAERILRPHYWNRWQADRIESQALANILVDWVWGSGRYGIAIPQAILGAPADGVVGEKTLGRLNSYPDPEGLFEKIKQARRAYLNMICIDRPENKRFLKGWLNRLNDFRWIPMTLLFCALLSCRSALKTETLNAKQTVETLRATSLHAARNEYGEQNGHLSQQENEIRMTETLTAAFDALDSKPVLKQLQIQRVVSDRTNHAEQQTERRTTGMEMQNGSETVETLRATSLQTELKEKPARNSVIWRIAGVAVAAALAWAGWRIIRLRQS